MSTNTYSKKREGSIDQGEREKEVKGNSKGIQMCSIHAPVPYMEYAYCVSHIYTDKLN